jgi:hypothetical protein
MLCRVRRLQRHGSSIGGTTNDANPSLRGYGGGGASDVQTVSGPVPVLLTQGPVSSQALASRLIVAGGGGGNGGLGNGGGHCGTIGIGGGATSDQNGGQGSSYAPQYSGGA